MSHSITKKMEHLYFPINWNAQLVNSRALGYLIGRYHPRLCIQLQSMFHNRLNLVYHQHRYIVEGARKQWSVPCYMLTKEQVIEYLAKYRNPYQATILKQLEDGVSYNNVVIHHARYIV